VLALSNAALRFRGPPGADTPAGSGSSGRQHHSRDAGAPPDPDAPAAKTVWVLRNGAPVQVAIHTGLTDGTNTEIVDGLTEDDAVITDLDSGDGSSAAPSSTRSTSLRPMF